MSAKIAPMRTLSFESCESMTQPEFAEWVARQEARDDNHYELLNARVVMEPPARWPHGRVGGRLLQDLGVYVRKHDLGDVLDASQGYELPSGDTVQPDIAFVSRERWAESTPPEVGKFLRVVPDLIVEILSPSTASRDRGEKRAIYERNGVREYWLVDPRALRVTCFRRRGDRFDGGEILGAGDELACEAIAGLILSVADVF